MFSIHLSFRRHLYHVFFEVPFFLDIKNTIKNKTRVLAGLKVGGGGRKEAEEEGDRSMMEREGSKTSGGGKRRGRK